MQLRISLGLILLATTTSLVGAAPARPQTAIAIAKRDVKCASADKNGAAFTSSSTAEESGNLFAVCSYGSSSSDCTYFTDGSFSSGGSSCPKGLVQDGSFAAGQGSSGGSSSGNTQQQQQSSQQEEKPAQQPQQPSQQQQQQTQQQTSGSIDPSIECAAKDDDGTPLIASNPTKDQVGNDFAECTYQGAGACTYFFADGSFSSGSSQCPQGQAQDGNGGGQQQQTPPQTSTPPPPPPQTTSTPPPPPPPTTSAPPPPPPTTTPPPPPPPPPPPSTPSATSTQVSFTTVVVPPPSEESGTSNNVPGQQGGLGAGVQLRPGMGMVLAVVPVVWVLFGFGL